MKQFAVFTLLVVFTAGCTGKTEGKKVEPGKTGGVIEGRTKPVSKTDEDAISAIKKLGGKVTTSVRQDGTSRVLDGGNRKIGRQNTVTKVRLSGPNVTDAALVHLRGLKDLDDLLLSQSGVSDAGLVHLQGLTQLHWLSLDGTNVTDAGLVHLKNLTKLLFLDLRSTKVTAAGVKKLGAVLTKCRIRR